MAKRDYYEVLGVPKNAPKDQIKKAYRELALKYHPDRNSGKDAEEKFKEVSEAYAVLSDDSKKQQYDQFGHAGFDQRFSQEDIFRNADFSDFSDLFRQFGFGDDIFSSMFGGARGFGRRSQGHYGADMRTEVEITLEEAAAGAKREFSLERDVLCKRCRGSGAEPGSGLKTCPKCAGRGQVLQTRRMGPMMFRSVAACDACRGEGRTIEKKCRDCSGSGAVSKEEKISVAIPGGIQDGMQIRLEGQGEQAQDGNGDLYVHVHVRPHKLFQRQRNDLYIEIPVSFTQAALGAKIEVPTIDGKAAKLEIPPGTASHTLFRMHGEGMPDVHGGRKGDELARVIVQVPKRLSQKQKELLSQFDEEGKKKNFGIF
ncbi:Chaperone protein DnaJ [uncultured archaeon]|nr:Chaperone protein DnaJ [uncultured archaeon]